MSLWGNKDGGALTGTTLGVTNGSKTVTGVGTTFGAEIEPGDVLIITSGTTTKNRVAAVANSTSLTLADNFSGTTAASLAAANVLLQQQPKYVYSDSNKSFDGTAPGKPALETVYGVDVTEAQVTANRAKGIQTAGWVKYVTYTDAQGKTRHKPEVLVAAGSMTAAVAGDAPDDSVVADS